MTFTANNLKQLKDKLKKTNYTTDKFEVDPVEIHALLARLEAAEECIAHSHGLASTWCCEKAKELDKAWKKTAGII